MDGLYLPTLTEEFWGISVYADGERLYDVEDNIINSIRNKRDKAMTAGKLEFAVTEKTTEELLKRRQRME